MNDEPTIAHSLSGEPFYFDPDDEKRIHHEFRGIDGFYDDENEPCYQKQEGENF